MPGQMMSLRMCLFLAQRPALLQSGDDRGDGFALAALVGRLRLGDPLAIQRFVRAVQP